MPFRLRKDTRAWFRDIEDAFTLDFDMYHLCLCAGLAEQRKESVPNEETTVLVENFPGDYRATGRVIVAFFLTVELEILGVTKEDRASLNSTIHRLVDPNSRAHISTEGMQAMNEYSYGGFESITEWFGSRPHTFETFIPEYKRNLDKAMTSLSDAPL